MKPNTARIWLLIALMSPIGMLLGLALYAYWWHRAAPSPDYEAYYRRLVTDELTNDVTGYRRTISIELEGNPYDYPVETAAVATVEFINHFGGVDRTNLSYIFLSGDTTNDGQVQHWEWASLAP
ncbi:MAG: hypothetical protein KGJ60_04280 [Verrucomicrobiota bacterium]|nr:hypothetical protein [Verrucomicrobiota bacterium]